MNKQYDNSSFKKKKGKNKIENINIFQHIQLLKQYNFLGITAMTIFQISFLLFHFKLITFRGNYWVLFSHISIPKQDESNNSNSLVAWIPCTMQFLHYLWFLSTSFKFKWINKIKNLITKIIIFLPYWLPKIPTALTTKQIHLVLLLNPTTKNHKIKTLKNKIIHSIFVDSKRNRKNKKRDQLGIQRGTRTANKRRRKRWTGERLRGIHGWMTDLLGFG